MMKTVYNHGGNTEVQYLQPGATFVTLTDFIESDEPTVYQVADLGESPAGRHLRDNFSTEDVIICINVTEGRITTFIPETRVVFVEVVLHIPPLARQKGYTRD